MPATPSVLIRNFASCSGDIRQTLAPSCLEECVGLRTYLSVSMCMRGRGRRERKGGPGSTVTSPVSLPCCLVKTLLTSALPFHSDTLDSFGHTKPPATLTVPCAFTTGRVLCSAQGPSPSAFQYQCCSPQLHPLCDPDAQRQHRVPKVSHEQSGSNPPATTYWLRCLRFPNDRNGDVLTTK